MWKAFLKWFTPSRKRAVTIQTDDGPKTIQVKVPDDTPTIEPDDITLSLHHVSDTTYWKVVIRDGITPASGLFSDAGRGRYAKLMSEALDLNRKEGRFNYIKEVTKLIGEAKNHLSKTDGNVYGLCSHIQQIAIERRDVLTQGLKEQISKCQIEGEMMKLLEAHLVLHVKNRNTVNRVIDWTDDTVLLNYADLYGHHESTASITSLQQRARLIAEAKTKDMKNGNH